MSVMIRLDAYRSGWPSTLVDEPATEKPRNYRPRACRGCGEQLAKPRPRATWCPRCGPIARARNAVRIGQRACEEASMLDQAAALADVVTVLEELITPAPENYMRPPGEGRDWR